MTFLFEREGDPRRMEARVLVRKDAMKTSRSIVISRGWGRGQREGSVPTRVGTDPVDVPVVPPFDPGSIGHGTHAIHGKAVSHRPIGIGVCLGAGAGRLASAMEEWETLHGHEQRVWSLAWSPDGRTLASCGQDRTVRLWRRGEGRGWSCSAVLEDAHGRSIRSCAWSNDGNVLAMASFDATITIWERKGEEWELATTLEGHESEVKGVAFSASGTYLASCSRDKTVWIWESHEEMDYDCVDVKQEHSQDVKAVTWHPHEDVLVSCSYDNTLRVWAEELDADEWECLQVLNRNSEAHESTVWAASFDRTGKCMASCSEDGSIAVWECQEQSGRGPWKKTDVVGKAHTRPIYSIDWSKTTGALATGAADDSIKLFRWEGDRLKEVCVRTNAHQSDVNCVRWHPQDPTMLASCGDDDTIRLWKCHL